MSSLVRETAPSALGHMGPASSEEVTPSAGPDPVAPADAERGREPGRRGKQGVLCGPITRLGGEAEVEFSWAPVVVNRKNYTLCRRRLSSALR
jgi:hypothetical protein